MVDKRTFNLLDADLADLTYYLLTDDAALSEAGKISIAELKTLLGVTNPVTSAVVVTSPTGATITNIEAEKVITGDLEAYSISFDYASGGETDPVFELDTAGAGSPFTDVPVLCNSIVSSVTTHKVSYLVGLTPIVIRVEGSFTAATFKISFTLINS